ncbi:MAG: copper amine oxidase N-terminal domain-containing protein [Defluviitaleaceae bacterium]|nr:copper amine oxidase N-terminal domain-containing protein [Defluviitaleaceae bacterium]
MKKNKIIIVGFLTIAAVFSALTIYNIGGAEQSTFNINLYPNSLVTAYNRAFFLDKALLNGETLIASENFKELRYLELDFSDFVLNREFYTFQPIDVSYLNYHISRARELAEEYIANPLTPEDIPRSPFNNNRINPYYMPIIGPTMHQSIFEFENGATLEEVKWGAGSLTGVPITGPRPNAGTINYHVIRAVQEMERIETNIVGTYSNVLSPIHSSGYLPYEFPIGFNPSLFANVETGFGRPMNSPMVSAGLVIHALHGVNVPPGYPQIYIELPHVTSQILLERVNRVLGYLTEFDQGDPENRPTQTLNEPFEIILPVTLQNGMWLTQEDFYISSNGSEINLFESRAYNFIEYIINNTIARSTDIEVTNFEIIDNYNAELHLIAEPMAKLLFPLIIENTSITQPTSLYINSLEITNLNTSLPINSTVQITQIPERGIEQEREPEQEEDEDPIQTPPPLPPTPPSHPTTPTYDDEEYIETSRSQTLRRVPAQPVNLISGRLPLYGGNVDWIETRAALIYAYPVNLNNLSITEGISIDEINETNGYIQLYLSIPANFTGAINVYKNNSSVIVANASMPIIIDTFAGGFTISGALKEGYMHITLDNNSFISARGPSGTTLVNGSIVLFVTEELAEQNLHFYVNTRRSNNFSYILRVYGKAVTQNYNGITTIPQVSIGRNRNSIQLNNLLFDRDSLITAPFFPANRETIIITPYGRVTIGGEDFNFDPEEFGSPNINWNGVSVLPARMILSILMNSDPNDNSMFIWDYVSTQFSVDPKGYYFVFELDSPIMYVGGVPRQILSGEGQNSFLTAPYIDENENSRLFVPTRTISELLGFTVHWNATNANVTLIPTY